MSGNGKDWKGNIFREKGKEGQWKKRMFVVERNDIKLD